MNAEVGPHTVFTVHALAPGTASASEMRAWKALIADAAATGTEVCLVFYGGANPITAYRLFYMLVLAKEAGVRRLTLRSDGLFIDEEASAWLAETGIDAIEIAGRPAAGVPRDHHHQ